MALEGDNSHVTKPGQFINIALPGFYLRRPISVCDKTENGLTIIYKAVGRGTEFMTKMKSGEALCALTGLGNGYDTSLSGAAPVLIGGGVGVPPLYLLAKELIKEGYFSRMRCKDNNGRRKQGHKGLCSRRHPRKRLLLLRLRAGADA